MFFVISMTPPAMSPRTISGFSAAAEDEVAQLAAQPTKAFGEGGLLASFQRCVCWGDPGQVSYWG
ncbi:hypothetical protein [Streptomyces roseicoloratus]|uniref:Uncharacterized protein n=1 Tax=Streptomyces roseicoloratus TaxID=2508722 RepID=A0ABY9RN18_9ACTN|nr:hypothetical protein [Streptomyces roseicoloratus]WMX43586.1 hypothetical protein RGF97_00010 [Streptomyces roseicoloratus]WMX48689.1 hypothetical protein RGF97_33260 [Streptomyces roseicoloratus]